jgi:phosphatidylglycerol:prolipoprotein diacylglycerol transferase
MYPEICKIGPFTVYSYGLMLVVAFTVSSILLRLQAKRMNFNPETIFNLCFFTFIAGIIGARIFYVIENLGYYLKRPQEVMMFAHGGLSWFGGLALGIFCAAIYSKNRKLPLYKTLDLIVPYLALAQAIGRIGCLLNGCCFGKASKFGVYFKVHQESLIPTQLYSSLILLLIFFVLRILQERPHKEGEVFWVYLLLYSGKRFLMEFLRADNQVIFLGLNLFQIISVVIFCFTLAKIAGIKKIKPKSSI